MTRAAALTAAVVAAAVTAVAGAPRELPDIALESDALFHLERATAFLVCAIAYVALVARAWRGQLPIELSTQGIKYSHESSALDDLADENHRAREERQELRRRIDALENDR
jgi:hypothetical protein